MIKLVDQLSPMGNFAVATATDIVCSDNERLQDKIDNGTLGGDNSIITTEAEYLALPEEEKLNNSYYLYDIGVHYKNGVAYSRKEPITLTMEEYKALGEVDPDQEYIISADAEGILLEASDISYSNAVSNLPCTTVQGAIDKIAETVEDNYAKKTDIPTTLPANGGNANTVNNHTVKSDVPENAVFTDTVYDDTEVKAEIAKKADKSYVDDNFATMDKLKFVPSTMLNSGFKVVAYSNREITGNSKLECLENWITNALSKYINNSCIIGNIYNNTYVDGFAIVNVWGDGTKGIIGASGLIVDQEGVHYYRKLNGTTESGTLTRII